MEDENKLTVKYGTIYCNGIGIDNMAVIIDTDGGLLKFGDAERHMRTYYADMTEKYKKSGCGDMCDSLLYIEFDRYKGLLTIEEICTFVNYMRLCSANGERIVKMLNMNAPDIKSELKKLSEIGY